ARCQSRASRHAGTGRAARARIDGLEPRDLDTLEFPRVLEAIASLARSAAGRARVLALRPTPDAAVAEERLETLAELVAQVADTGRPPTTEVALLAPVLAAAAPEGGTLEPRRLADVRELLATAAAVRLHPPPDADRLLLPPAHAAAP